MQPLVDLLLELQALDRVPRAGYALRGVAEPESVSEHTFHVAFLVWALAPRVPEVEAHRALELALVHDLAEARTGDLPRTAARYLLKGAKDQLEIRAVTELLSPLGDRGARLLAEYQARATPEARFVAACDKLQLLLKALTYEGWGAAGLGELWRHSEAIVESGFEPLGEIAQELCRRRQDGR